MTLYPRCHPRWINGPAIDNSISQRGIHYTGTGHILPCCWCDYNDNIEFHEMGMLDDKLKLENNKSVKDIIFSKQWILFHNTLLNNAENAPKVCKEKCSKSSVEIELNAIR